MGYFLAKLILKICSCRNPIIDETNGQVIRKELCDRPSRTIWQGRVRTPPARMIDVNNVNKLCARNVRGQHPAQRKDEKTHHTIQGKARETTTSGNGKRK